MLIYLIVAFLLGLGIGLWGGWHFGKPAGYDEGYAEGQHDQREEEKNARLAEARRNELAMSDRQGFGSSAALRASPRLPKPSANRLREPASVRRDQAEPEIDLEPVVEAGQALADSSLGIWPRSSGLDRVLDSEPTRSRQDEPVLNDPAPARYDATCEAPREAPSASYSGGWGSSDSSGGGYSSSDSGSSCGGGSDGGGGGGGGGGE